MQTEDALDKALREHPFLGGLAPNHLAFLKDHASLRQFAAETQILHEGAPADQFYLILGGGAELETYVPGSGMVGIQFVGPEQVLGTSCMFPPYQWKFAATTRAPTEAVVLDAVALREKAAQDPEFRREFLARLAEILYQREHRTLLQLIHLCETSA